MPRHVDELDRLDGRFGDQASLAAVGFELEEGGGAVEHVDEAPALGEEELAAQGAAVVERDLGRNGDRLGGGDIVDFDALEHGSAFAGSASWRVPGRPRPGRDPSVWPGA